MINVKTTPLKLWRYYVKYRFLRFFSSYLFQQVHVCQTYTYHVPVTLGKGYFVTVTKYPDPSM